MSVVVDGEIELVSEPSGVPPVRGQGLSASARSDKGSKDESCQCEKDRVAMHAHPCM